MAPTILLQTLESVRRRVRWLTLVTGIGLVLAATVAVLVVVAGLDFVMNLPAIPRTLLDLIAVGSLGYSVWRWVVHPLLNRLTLNDVAGRVERAYPQFEDRLRSTVDIMLGREVPGSEIMRQRVVSEATRLANGLDLSRVVVVKPAYFAISAGTAALLLLLGLFSIVDPTYSRTAMSRLFTPFANVQWPKTVEIAVVSSIPSRVTVGQRIDFNIRLNKGDKPSRKAIIYYSYGDAAGQHFSTPEQQLMIRGDDGVYHATVDARVPADALAGSVQIHIESGDAQTPPTTVFVVQRLSLKRVDAEVTAPPYAHVPTVKITLGQTPGVMTIGSTVKFIASFNKQLDPAKTPSVKMIGTDHPSPIIWAEAAGNTVTGTMTATESIRFSLAATDIDGITNPAAEEFELIAKPDMNPTVAIENPRHNEDYTPEAVVPLQAVAEDDFGIASLSLMVDRLGDKKHWEIPLVVDSKPTDACKWNPADDGGESHLQRFRAGYAWTLNSMQDAGLKPGDVLQYYATVRDNYVLNGQVHDPVSSGWLRITIISQAQFDTGQTEVLNALADHIVVAKQNQITTEKQTQALAEELKDKDKLDEADLNALARLAAQEASAASEVNALANKADDVLKKMDENRSTNADLKSTATDVRNLLKAAAEQPMKDAAGDLNEAPKASSKDERKAEMTGAVTAQGKAAAKLQTAIDRMGSLMGPAKALENAEALLKDQKDLEAQTTKDGKTAIGKTAEQLTPEEKKNLEADANAQNDLGKRTDKAIGDMRIAAAKMSKSAPTDAAALNNAADIGQNQNIPGKQKDAAAATKGNNQSKAQGAQKEAAAGLQAMVNDLKEAQARKLEELSRKLDELQKQAQALIRQQAGHNLNDIALQPPADRDKVERKTLDELTVYSERDKNPLTTPVDLGMLSAGQEQTERNTRDIAKTAEEMPDGAEPSDRLTRAADKMARAIVNLRGNKITAAYDPAQQDALNELIEAKKVIDEQKKKADEKKQGQKKQQIKEKLLKIRVAQMDVNAGTDSVDAKRNPDGSFSRAEWVTLTGLGTQQGKISDDTKALDTDLAGVGSVVYTYVNDQIVQNMNEIKTTLASKQAGPAVRAQEQAVLDLLDAMIKDLDTDPEKLPFNQKSGGNKGGGQGGDKPKPLPTESELRLLKFMQEKLNTATIAAAAAPTLTPGTMAGLGKEQGNLRETLDKLMRKATEGKVGLPLEPKDEDHLPEEGSVNPKRAAETVDNAEFENSMLGVPRKPKIKLDPAIPGVLPVGPTPPTPEPAGEDEELNTLGDRMARARQRLANHNDPGAITQEIQKRILTDLDSLIEEARKKEADGQNQPPQPPNPDDGSKMDGKKPADGAQPQDQKTEAEKKLAAEAAEAQAKIGKTPGGGGGKLAADPGNPELSRNEAKVWGSISDREREALTESKGEKVLDKYQKLVDDYYRAMSTKSADGQ